jgi:hypothetical protein
MDVDRQQASAGEIAPLCPASRARGCTSVASPSSSLRHHSLPTVVELLISLTSSRSATSVAGSARRWRASETTQVAGGAEPRTRERACCHWPMLAVPGCCRRRSSAATALEEIPGDMEPRPAVVACANPTAIPHLVTPPWCPAPRAQGRS